MAVSAIAAIGSSIAGSIGTAVAWSAASAFAISTTTFAMISAATSFVVMAGIGAIARSALGKPQQQSQSLAAESQARTQVIRSAVANHQVIYGNAVVSGTLIFASSSGTDNEYIHLVIALAGHPVTSIDDVWLGDDELGDIGSDGNPYLSKYSGHVRIKKHLGGVDQEADADLVAEVPEWTTAHRLRGIAYLYVRLHFSAEVFPSGLPNIKASVGRYLPMPSASYVGLQSNNFALVVRDYLTNPDYGLGCTEDEIDDAAFITAANVSNELAERWPGSAGMDYRYTMNGAFDTGVRPLDVLNKLLSAGAGTLTYSQGKYRLTAGDWINPVTTLTADDLRGPLSVRPRPPRSSLFNAVRGTYIPFNSPATDFPMQRDDAYKAQDGGVEIATDIELPFTASVYAAQRIARQHLDRARQGITVDFPGKLTCAHIPMDDIILLDMPLMGWSQKPFRVKGWTLAGDGMGVDLTLQEEAELSYTWDGSTNTVVDDAPDTSLKLYPEIVSYTVTESLVVAAGAVVPKVHVELVTTGVFRGASIVWSMNDGAHQGELTSDLRSFDLILPDSGRLTLTITPFGLASGPGVTITTAIAGKTSPPANVADLSFSGHGDSATLSWQPSVDLDVIVGGMLVVRYSADTEAPWDACVEVLTTPGSATSATLQVPFRTGVWLARWMDSSGHLSPTATRAQFSNPGVSNRAWPKLVADHTEAPAWAGTSTNLEPLGAGLTLNGASATGTYRTAAHDFGVVRQARCQMDADFTTYTNAPIDSITLTIQDWPDIDGANLDDVAVTTWLRTTDDDPAGAPAWSEWRQFSVASDLIARALQIELRIGTADPLHNLWLTGLNWDA